MYKAYKIWYNDNVKQNTVYGGKNMAKTLYDVMEDLGIRICPICGNEYTEHPAISRKDNITEICPTCGMKEALDDYLNHKSQNKNK